jgi:hypothetical protein
MMRTGNGCRRRGEAACGGVILDNAVACDIGCYPQLPVRHKTAKKPRLSGSWNTHKRRAHLSGCFATL